MTIRWQPVINNHPSTTRANASQLSAAEWRVELEIFHAMGSVSSNWPMHFGLPPHHPATRVPWWLLLEFGYRS